MKIRDLLADQKYQQKKVLEKILCHHTGLSKEALIVNYDTDVSDDVLEKIKNDYKEYTENDKPLEYIFGYVEFFQRKFKIDGRSLIPRPETEYMIEAVNEHITNSKLRSQKSELQIENKLGSRTYDLGGNKVMLDVGTGTGVLGLSVLAENPGFFKTAFLTEYYEDTLSLAKENFETYSHQGALGNTAIHVIHANLIDFLIADEKSKLYDLGPDCNVTLVANLPYIPDEVFDTQTEDNVRKWEPRPAFVGGHDGLDFYREMFAQIFAYQKTSPQRRTMFLEMMTRQVDILRKEFGEMIDFDEIKTFHFNIRIVKGIVK